MTDVYLTMTGSGDYVMTKYIDRVAILVCDGVWCEISHDNDYVYARLRSDYSNDGMTLSWAGAERQKKWDKTAGSPLCSGKLERQRDIDPEHGKPPLKWLTRNLYTFDGDRRSVWLEVCGTGVVIYLFKWADSAGVSAELYRVDGVDRRLLGECAVSLHVADYAAVLQSALKSMRTLSEEVSYSMDRFKAAWRRHKAPDEEMASRAREFGATADKMLELWYENGGSSLFPLLEEEEEVKL